MHVTHGALLSDRRLPGGGERYHAFLPGPDDAVIDHGVDDAVIGPGPDESLGGRGSAHVFLPYVAAASSRTGSS